MTFISRHIAIYWRCLTTTVSDGISHDALFNTGVNGQCFMREVTLKWTVGWGRVIRGWWIRVRGGGCRGADGWPLPMMIHVHANISQECHTWDTLSNLLSLWCFYSHATSSTFTRQKIIFKTMNDVQRLWNLLIFSYISTVLIYSCHCIVDMRPLYDEANAFHIN